MVIILIYACERAEFNPASDERPDFTGERAGSGRRIYCREADCGNGVPRAACQNGTARARPCESAVSSSNPLIATRCANKYSKHLALADKGGGAMLPWREHDDPQEEHVTIGLFSRLHYLSRSQPRAVHHQLHRGRYAYFARPLKASDDVLRCGGGPHVTSSYGSRCAVETENGSAIKQRVATLRKPIRGPPIHVHFTRGQRHDSFSTLPGTPSQDRIQCAHLPPPASPRDPQRRRNLYQRCGRLRLHRLPRRRGHVGPRPQSPGRHPRDPQASGRRLPAPYA